MKRPRVLFTCAREAQYVRDLLVRRALRQHFELLEITDTRPGSLIVRHLRLLPRLLLALRSPCDVIFVGFYGHLLTPLISQLTRKPILFDAFLSTWDTLCFDRQTFGPNSIAGRLAYWLDRQACLRATHSLLDTQTHARYFVDTFGIPEHKLSAYYVGYDEQLFCPMPRDLPSDRFVVFFYGSFLPLQGVEHIVGAAKLLEAESDIDFHIIGGGMTYPAVRQLAEEQHVQRLFFHPVVPYLQLPQAIAAASVCLGGPFGPSAKASRVIAGKTFQFLAMAKPTIVGNSPANREVFRDGDDVIMCTMADAQALAAAILALKRDRGLRERIAQQGYEHCRERFGIEKQGQRLERIISAML
jgi:glycosyltransferase involved in cell wall biosynthesis